MVGPPWRVSLDNPSCRTFYREPASNGNSSTIATAREQCQTQICACYRHVSIRETRGNERFGGEKKSRNEAARNFTVELKFSFLIQFSPLAASANLPCYGLSVDAVAVCLRLFHGKDRRMRVLRCAKGERRRQD